MKVVLYGASGMIGSRILEELVRRGHTVTAVVRHPEKIKTHARVKAIEGDITDTAGVTSTVQGMDAVISAYSPPPSEPEHVVDAARSLMAGLQQAGVARLIVVGGAGSLEVAPGLQLVDTPDFPAGWKAIALAHREVLPLLKASDLNWSYFSPAALIEPGLRTGKFRLAGTRLVSNDKGESRVSAEDYAVALVDELEKPEYVRKQFTIGY